LWAFLRWKLNMQLFQGRQSPVNLYRARAALQLWHLHQVCSRFNCHRERSKREESLYRTAKFGGKERTRIRHASVKEFESKRYRLIIPHPLEITWAIVAGYDEVYAD